MAEIKPRNLLLYMFAGLAVILGVGALMQHRPASASYSCTAGQNEICPPDSWMRDYQQMRALQASIQDKTDVIQGMMTRLRGEMPAGYNWDEKKGKFVLAPQAQVPPK